ncbi:DpnII family type II restriction endonuclease [Helicobacter cappadocius]|uniref:DpnII family type II restriction endonuclease n=1 Tax=Helicobacter cappadocius TaxID=3063998 RepID=A0AA90PI20_9HELI|nr:MULTISPECIES: DpnII family type II restriction endonuclease [unclassified Helicobacter]MDO7252334.1 DpnII family type II restriction endonuclease [Helicobacter sp. faydin-H75]MDP2538201.1 DpnII family type II restriction endonuclease [Helicobacter sp. faydin-H76]
MNKKYETVINKNTFYFSNWEFEENYEANTINLLKILLLNLKNDIANRGCKQEIFIDFIQKNEFGLECLLVLNGLANENLKRIITIARIVQDKELCNLLRVQDWDKGRIYNDVKEWSDKKIKNLIKEDRDFATGLIDLFFRGSTNSFLAKTLPLFELKKLELQKINFDSDVMVDTLIRYRQKGSYSGCMGNNPETIIETILNDLKINFEKGDLPELFKNEKLNKRTMDFIIPDKKSPKIIIESSFLSTTSSGQGDKAKTELSIAELIKKHYPKARFVGFVDGIGWYVRKQDLKRMVEAYDDVFTFHLDELERFKKVLENV